MNRKKNRLLRIAKYLGMSGLHKEAAEVKKIAMDTVPRGAGTQEWWDSLTDAERKVVMDQYTLYDSMATPNDLSDAKKSDKGKGSSTPVSSPGPSPMGSQDWWASLTPEQAQEEEERWNSYSRPY